MWTRPICAARRRCGRAARTVDSCSGRHTAFRVPTLSWLVEECDNEDSTAWPGRRKRLANGRCDWVVTARLPRLRTARVDHIKVFGKPSPSCQRCPAYSAGMLRRRTRLVWALAVVATLIASALGQSAMACAFPSRFQHFTSAAGPCGIHGAASCCASSCAVGQATADAKSSTRPVVAVATIVRVNFEDRVQSAARAALRAAGPPPERPPAIRFSVLRI